MAVTKLNRACIACGLLLVSQGVFSIVLPEDRVDSLGHVYTGGGITIVGPSILVRKSVSDSVSVSANYYVDSISSASVDVVTSGASRYTEERTQISASVDYLHDSSIMSYAYSTSSENDYEAKTSSLSISQEMFGGLTTVAMGYKFGDNIVMDSTDAAFKDTAQTKGYRVSLAQVLTKNIILGSAYEVITDKGMLNNPYRSVRYLTDTNGTYAFEPEEYPRSRTSNALGFNLRYFLPYRASISGGYRYYIDSWEIEASTYEFGYVHPLGEHLLFDFSLRFYSQTSASFYGDLFIGQQDPDVNDYRARDKELSSYDSQSIGAGVTLKLGRILFFEKASINLFLNYFVFEYDNFRDVPYGQANALPGGTEPLYELDATVGRFYLSGWF